jgi:hypothetical protein
MDAEVARLTKQVEVSVRGLAERFDFPTYYFDCAMKDLKDYLATKEITDPQRRCTDKTHHFKGCDCW